MLDIKMKYVSFKDVPVGFVWEGIYGGRFINKWGRESITLYSTEDGEDVCLVLPRSAGLKQKIIPNAYRIEVKYGGMGFTGKFHAHNFDVKCQPLNMSAGRELKIQNICQKHTESLNCAPLNPIKKKSIFEVDELPSEQPKEQKKATASAFDPFAVAV